MGLDINTFQPGEDSYNVTAATPTPGRIQVNFNAVKRRLRFASPTGSGDYWIKFGDATVVADTTTSMLALGGTVEMHTIPSKKTHVSVLAATTSVSVNIVPGSGT